MKTQRVSSRLEVDEFYNQLMGLKYQDWIKITKPESNSVSYSFHVFDWNGNTLLLCIYYYE